MPEDIFHQLNSGFGVSRETFNRLKLYCDLLLKWQLKINLIGPDTVSDIWNRHFIDSLQLLDLIPDTHKIRVDFGTGAGFPGMALAIAGAGEMHLIESDAKKITFLREVARVTNISVHIHHCRVEDRPITSADIIMSRACASLSKLFDMASSYVSHETILLFPKGKNYLQDILDAKDQWLFDYTLIPSVTDTLGVIVRVTHLTKKT